MKSQFLEPWTQVGEFASNLVDELQRELIDGHDLYGRSVVAIAQRIDSDDVLFKVNDGTAYAVVRLTWNGKPEQSPKWPDTKLFPTLEEWQRLGMAADHEEFVGAS